MASRHDQVMLALQVNGNGKAPIYPGGLDRGLKRVVLFRGKEAAPQRS